MQLQQYLSVLCGDLEEQCQAAVVKVVIQGNQSSMHTAFQQDVGVVPQAYALHPADDPLITPHQNVCRDKYGLQMFSHMFGLLQHFCT